MSLNTSANGTVLCIIPARGGSKRIPHKNIVDFKGKPIIAYSIEAVRKSGVADEIMVSTDDVAIAEVAKRYGASVPFFRNAATADDKTGIADVLLEVLGRYREIGKTFEFIVCVLATAPLLQAGKLAEAFRTLCEHGEADSICSVQVFNYPPQRGLIVEDGKLKMLHAENYFKRSQDLVRIYHDCGQFFIFRTEALLRDKKLYTKHMLPCFLEDIESQDIDNWEDLWMAEMKFDALRRRGLV